MTLRLDNYDGSYEVIRIKIAYITTSQGISYVRYVPFDSPKYDYHEIMVDNYKMIHLLEDL